MPPQIFNCQNYSNKLDVWSLGAIFYEMLYGKTPWRVQDLYNSTYGIKSLDLEFPVNPAVSYYTQQLITGMLQKEEENRMGWEDLFKIFLGDLENMEEETYQLHENCVLIKNELKLSNIMEEQDLPQKQMGEIEMIRKDQELNIAARSDENSVNLSIKILNEGINQLDVSVDQIFPEIESSNSNLKSNNIMEEQDLHKKLNGDIQSIMKTLEFNRNYFKKKNDFRTLHDIELHENKLQIQISQSNNQNRQENKVYQIMQDNGNNMITRNDEKYGNLLFKISNERNNQLDFSVNELFPVIQKSI